MGAYGCTKLECERTVAATGGTWAVLRTSWAVSAHGNNIVKTMLRLGRERDSFSIIADQIGDLPPARAIASAFFAVSEALRTKPEKADIYHFSATPSPAGRISPAGYSTAP